MSRHSARLSLFLLILLAASACATSAPAPAPDPTPAASIDPYEDPAAVAAIADGADEAIKGAETGRRIGTAVGILAAVFGGPSHEPLDHAIDRFFIAQELGEGIGAIVGASRGARRGIALDAEMAELEAIDGIDVSRRIDPRQIDVELADAESPQLAGVAAILLRHDNSVTIEAGGDAAFAARDALIEAGVPPQNIDARREENLPGVVLHIRRAHD